MLLTLANHGGLVIWTNTAQGIEMRFPEDCFPAVACCRNGVIVYGALRAFFMTNELMFMRTLAEVAVPSGFS